VEIQIVTTGFTADEFGIRRLRGIIPPFLCCSKGDVMEDLLSLAVPEGGFGKVENMKGGPIPSENVLENIRESAKIELPVFDKVPRREGSMIFVAGGSTLLNYLDEIRERKNNGEFIVTSNKTYDYLVDNDIIADVCCVLDPKEICKTYIANPQKETLFLIGTVCHPDVAKGLIEKGMTVNKLLIGYGLEDDSDLDLQKELYPDNIHYLSGGTMMGLRAMNLAPLLGFFKIEYYGFDSCFSQDEPKLVHDDDSRYEQIREENGGMFYEDAETGKQYTIDDNGGGFFYAYKKKRHENIVVAKTSDGRRFMTSPCFAHQAKQFVKWFERLEGKLEIIIHGDSLTSHLQKCMLEARDKAVIEMGDKRWTDDYAEQQRQMHKITRYGYSGTSVGGREFDTELMSRGILALYHSLGKRNLTVLDYGCGQGELTEQLDKIFKILDFTKYDPFIEEHSKEPDGKFDILCCLDVMEHIEMPCIDNVLNHIASKVKYMVQFRICTALAQKVLPNGKNAHITVKHGEWWYQKLSKHFIIAEGISVDDYAYYICQSMDAQEYKKDEEINE
jgi:2-polyprenyl-3-methyl-5-hydroxy-6-metoxy-1,4-benzoquinol methylase